MEGEELQINRQPNGLCLLCSADGTNTETTAYGRTHKPDTDMVYYQCHMLSAEPEYGQMALL